SPTQWQRQSYPSIVQDRIEVIHDGIDTDTVKPDPAARFQLPDGRWLTSNDEVITFVKQRAILTRLGVETASKSFHPSVS
ncbi:hypothetical protein QN416_26855, partial [Glaciimonas sp. Cout2]|nr:hypothetical protein [Glaciimonas sp. Cout2]